MEINKNLPVKTDRLLLDKFNKEDWKDFYKIETSKEQHRFNFNKYNPRSEEKVKEYISKLVNQDYNKLQLPMIFAIRMMKDPALIGFIGFKNGKLLKNGKIEVYYSLYKDFWNKGYGTEALKGIIKFGFINLKLHRIFAGCDIDNFASKKIMEKAGMRFESRWRKDRLRNDIWTDGLGFAILEEDLNY